MGFFEYSEPFDLVSTLDGGQAFRWRREEDQSDGSLWLEGVVFSNALRIRQVTGGLEWQTSPGSEISIEPILRDYLRLDDDFSSMMSALDFDDALRDVFAEYKGLRILRQEPWECLVSFICSANNNIPRIKKNVEDMASAFGSAISESSAGRNAFPSPAELAEAAATSVGDGGFDATRWGEDNLGRIAPLWLLKQLPNMPACHVAIQHDARGPNNTITSRDSSALLALAEAVRVIERDAADAVIVGACSANIQPVDLTKLNLFENLSRREDDPETASRPFDMTRDGAVVGEGAAAFVVERYEHAINRGATIYGEVLGVGAGCDGAGYSNGSGGRGVARSIQSALRRADIEPRDIGHINAHGQSTQRDDLVEARGYYWGLGDAAARIPVTALKSYFGHFEAGSGAVELAGTLMSLRHQMVPSTLNYHIPDPRCRLNVVHDGPMELRSPTAMTINRTSMGQSAAAIIRAI